MNIRVIPYQQIDKEKWDNCIAHAGNGLIYGYSVYLDTMAANWDALVLNDYEAVMPLVWKKKYGVYYLYQPYFTACLGVFGNDITIELLHSFLLNIPSRFKYWDIYLNHGNNFPLPDFQFQQRINYVLNLNKPYETIYNNYRENIKRNIKKAFSLNCTVQKNIPVEAILKLYKEQSIHFASIPEMDFENFRKLFYQLQQQQEAISYGVYAPSGELAASCVFFFSNRRAYYILVGNHPNGRTIGASHALIDAFIKDYAGQNILLDFEGSDLRNLAFFYNSFGSDLENYPAIRLNRLPFWMKWLKK